MTSKIILIIWFIGFSIYFHILRKDARSNYENNYSWFEVFMVIFFSVIWIIPLVFDIFEKIKFKVPKPPKWL